MSTLRGIASLEQLDRGPLEEGGWLANKRVFIRVDFNVPCDKKTGAITDDSRIRAALESINFAVEAGARVVLASHLGRPKGERSDELSLENVGLKLAELSGYEVHLPEESTGDAPRKVIHDLRVVTPGGQMRGGPQLCLLENLRFSPGEEADDEGFARELAELCDVYIGDAFGVVHRAHASVHALPRLKKDRGAGFLVRRELEALSRLVDAPERPYVAVLGGAKVSGKIEVIEALLQRVDAICIGGAMANTFLAAQGHPMRESLVEEDKFALARTLLDKAKRANVELLLPSDVVVGQGPSADRGQLVKVSDVPPGMMALDIGPASVERFAGALARAKTMFWNGPMGLFESAPFAEGTRGLAMAMSKASGFTVVGGGDSAAAVREAGEDIAAAFDHISTGGGASLKFIEGAKLPGIEALRQDTLASSQ